MMVALYNEYLTHSSPDICLSVSLNQRCFISY